MTKWTDDTGQIMKILPIPGFDEYFIDTKGRVYSKHTEKVLKPRVNKYGYLQLELSKNGKTYTKLISRLVAQTYILNPDEKPCVNHKDGDKLNNYFENLEWMTVQENITHAIETGLRNPEMAVDAYDYKSGVWLSAHPSMLHALNEYKVTPGIRMGDVSRCVAGKRKQAKGLTFRKANPDGTKKMWLWD